MRLSLSALLTLIPTTLASCDQLPGAAPLEPADVCWDAGNTVAGRDATGAECPDPESPISYSLLGPNVKLLVDRSGSMSGDRWNALMSLTPYLPMVGERANLGLSFFPGPLGECSVEGGEVVPVTRGDLAVELIADGLASTQPDGGTPMAAAIRELATDRGLQCTNRNNVVVLLTDGEESCDGSPADAVRELVSGPVPIELFVIGFGTSDDANAALREVAAAASTTTDGENFFTADTVDGLVARLAAATGTCIAQLDVDVTDAALVVTLDGESLAACSGLHCERGYTYEPTNNTVTLQGADCLAIQDGACHTLQFDQRR